MSLDASSDSKSVSDLATHTNEIIEQVLATGRPVIVSSEGRGDVVIVDAAVFDRCLKAANLATLLAEGEADIRAGRTRPIEDFLSELEGDQALPS